jgi:hypothetical protein
MRSQIGVFDGRKRFVGTLLIAISMFFATSGIYAAEPSSAAGTKKPGKPPEQSDWLRICATFGQAAEKIMTDRQSDVPREKMIHSVQGDYLFEYIVIEAYKVPRISADRMRRSIEEFRDRIYLECVDAARLK